LNTETKPSILIVEDEEDITTMLKYNLEKDNFDVTVVDDGENAIGTVEDISPDLILLDWMLPNLSGVEICQRLRQMDNTRTIPIIMLTARGEEADLVTGLDSGADDYIVKPFSPKEVIARIRAVLRRTRPVLSGKIIEYAGIQVDMGGHKATYDEKAIHLGPTEFRLLAHLLESPGHVFSRDQLLDSVWGRDVYVETRTVDVHIRRLRKALSETQEGLDDLVKTVRSAGYVLEKVD